VGGALAARLPARADCRGPRGRAVRRRGRHARAGVRDRGSARLAGGPARGGVCDLDGFKTYNDTFGHLAGDALLGRLGAKLADTVAPHGTAYRLGGDEFCALLSLDDAEVDNLICRAADALGESGEQFAIRASLGAVLLPHEADSPDHALQLADERMYMDKRGRAAGPRDEARDVLMRTIEAKQPDLDEHADEVAELARRVARRLDLTGETIDEVVRAAELHDVGKVGIPDAILNKPGPLDRGEWEFMRRHTVLASASSTRRPRCDPWPGWCAPATNGGTAPVTRTS
jgi:GGDEF domain-containing protein